MERSASDRNTDLSSVKGHHELSLAARYGAAVLSVVLATLIRWLLDPYLRDRQPYATFYIAVTITAWYAGLWPSVLAAILGFAFGVWFSVDPRDEVIAWGGTVAMYFFVTLAIAGFGEAMRAARRRAVLKAEELLRAQLALGEGQQRLRAVVEHVVDGLITIDERGAIQSFNPAAERIFGYRADEVIGRNVSLLMPEPYHSEHDRYIGHYLATGKAKIIGIGREAVGRRKDGSAFPLDLAVSEFRVDGQRFFSGITRDITERKRAEEAIRESEHALRFLAETSMLLVALVDYQSTLQKVAWLSIPFLADWCVVYLRDEEDDGQLRRAAMAHPDPEKEKLVGMATDRLHLDAQSPLSVVRVLESGEPELLAEIQPCVSESVMSGEEREAIRRLNPTSIMHVPLVVRDHRLGVMTFVATDSGRKYGQADLQLAEEFARRVAVAVENARLYHEVREADRRKDEFLAMLAHELRNPLAAISNGMYLLRRATSPDRTRWVQDLIDRQTRQLARIIDDLLDVSRISRGKIRLNKENLDLAKVIEASAESVRDLMAERKHTFSVDVPAEPLPVQGDPARLQQIVVNLLTNAAKYTDEGGRVWLSAQREADQIVVRVRDNGIGIPPEMQPRIFNLFDQVESALDRSKGGLGIGLTLVQRLTGLHDGCVSVYSEGSGKGSEFTVRLPAAEVPDESSPAQPAAAPEVPQGLRIQMQ